MSPLEAEQRADQVLKPLAAGVFFVFFNGYMIAPLIPALASQFQVSIQRMGLVIPAYLLTYGFATLIYGPLSDRVGRKKVLLIFLSLTVFATAPGALAWSADSLIGFRVLCGLCAAGFLPISLALIGDLYPYEKLGRPLGWMFGAVAGGMSFGSTVGAWLNPVIGWRLELVGLAAAMATIWFLLFKRRNLIEETKTVRLSVREVAKNYVSLFVSSRGSKLYGLIFVNGAFQSGIFSWLGLYLVQRYRLGDAAIGTALIGYGLPGMFLGPALGRLADRFGRKRIIPSGFFLGALCAFALIPTTPIWIFAVLVTLLSVGYDMTHPLMSGVVTKLDPTKRGQAMGLNAFSIFTGLGLGSLAFQFLMVDGMKIALFIFAVIQASMSVFSMRVFKAETAKADASAFMSPEPL